MVPGQERGTEKVDLPALERTEIEQAKPGPQSPQRKRDAAKAMAHTAAWQPALGGRRESYSLEDRRREVMMSTVSSAVGEETDTGDGVR